MEDIEQGRKPLGWRGNLVFSVLALALFAGLYTASLHDYLLFHIVAEGFSIVVAASLFLLVWNSRRLLENDYLLFLGITFLFVGVLDSAHTLTYQGMNIVSGATTNHATQFWIAARYTEAVTLFFAPFFLRHRLKLGVVFSLYTLGVISITVLFFP